MDSRNLLPMNSATQSADFLPVVPFRSVICGMYADRMAFMALLTLLVTQSELHRLVILKGGIFEAGFGEKVAFSCPSVDRFGKYLGGLIT